MVCREVYVERSANLVGIEISLIVTYGEVKLNLDIVVRCSSLADKGLAVADVTRDFPVADAVCRNVIGERAFTAVVVTLLGDVLAIEHNADGIIHVISIPEGHCQRDGLDVLTVGIVEIQFMVFI